jgi:hypothetical protein
MDLPDIEHARPKPAKHYTAALGPEIECQEMSTHTAPLFEEGLARTPQNTLSPHGKKASSGVMGLFRKIQRRPTGDAAEPGPVSVQICRSSCEARRLDGLGPGGTRLSDTGRWHGVPHFGMQNKEVCFSGCALQAARGSDRF